MPSEEALRAAKAIRADRIRGDRSLEADAEIIDREFAALRDRAEALERQTADLLGNEVHLAEAEMERDKLRGERDKLLLALGPRGWHDCSACKGCGGSWKRRQWGECECRKELGL